MSATVLPFLTPHQRRWQTRIDDGIEAVGLALDRGQAGLPNAQAMIAAIYVLIEGMPPRMRPDLRARVNPLQQAALLAWRDLYEEHDCA